MKTSNRFLALAASFALALAFTFSGCANAVSLDRVNLTSSVPPSQIPKLRNETVNAGIEIQKQTEKIMGSYLDNSTGEFGYYTVNFTYRNDDNLGFVFWTNSFTLYVLTLVGFPAWSSTSNLSAELSIYDSQRNLVKTYGNSKEYTNLTGIYYGHGDRTPKAGKTFSGLFEDLLKQAKNDAGVINTALKAAGPVKSGAKLYKKGDKMDVEDGYYVMEAAMVKNTDYNNGNVIYHRVGKQYFILTVRDQQLFTITYWNPPYTTASTYIPGSSTYVPGYTNSKGKYVSGYTITNPGTTIAGTHVPGSFSESEYPIYSFGSLIKMKYLEEANSFLQQKR